MLNGENQSVCVRLAVLYLIFLFVNFFLSQINFVFFFPVMRTRW